ncbi:MAG: GAF domain-containing protein [Deltaproteobacteria bacterium]|nr:GAF domain-containing protein [Deltaproteobacteria bacterium]
MAGIPDRAFSILSRIIEISNSNIQIENRLKHICDFLARESGVGTVCIYQRDRRGDDLIPWVSSSAPVVESLLIDFRIRPGEGVAGKAAQKRVPVYCADAQTEPPMLAVPGEMRTFVSILSIPIMDDVYLYGAMNLSSTVPRRFSEEDVALLRVVATEVAGTIRNSRLYHDARKRVSELVTLNEIGRAITSTFHLTEILEYVAKTTSRLLSADGCTVRLTGKTRGAFQVMVDEGYARPGFKREIRAYGTILARQILREKRPLLINGPEDSPLSLALSNKGIVSFLGLPILSKGKALGVLSYYSCSPRVTFDMEVVNLMQTVCSQLSNIIENVTMFREMEALATENQVKALRFSTLYTVAQALMSTVKTDRILQILLHALTSADGLNFSRGIMFLLSPDGRTLAARMAMGPRDKREAHRVVRLAEGLAADEPPAGEEAPRRELLWPDVERFVLPLDSAGCLVARAVREGKPVRTEQGCQSVLVAAPDGFCGSHPQAFAVVPLVIKGEARGAIYVDNRFREREITDEDIQLLTMFASEACLALENARLYESLEGALSTIRSTQDRLVQSEKLAALGEMAAKIAHEIKNPLTVIGGFAARMARKEREAADAVSGRYTGIILKEVQRLERIIHQTLYFSRDVVPAFRPVSVCAEIRDVLAMFRDELDEAGIETVTGRGEDLPEIQGDPDQVRQLLWNLISNAIQAMERGGTLTVRARPATPEEGDGVVLHIGDTGGGIPHDIVHNIFNPFFTTKAKGTGLGLPIVHAIVEKHGGSIHLDNREGEGVNFFIFLPRVPRESKPADRILEHLRKGENGAAAVKERSG